MVVHRTCSFCAGEIEPGTGQLFVKRDGSLFAFCSSSCRKQQLGLGRVGHRLRWTHAHELKRLAEQRRQPTAVEPPKESEEGAPTTMAKPSPAGKGGAGPRKKAAPPKVAEKGEPAEGEKSEPGAKKPRAKKAPPASDSS